MQSPTFSYLPPPSPANAPLHPQSDAWFASKEEAETALDNEGYFKPEDDDDDDDDDAPSGTPSGDWPAALTAAAELSPPVALRAFGGVAAYLKRLLLDKQV